MQGQWSAAGRRPSVEADGHAREPARFPSRRASTSQRRQLGERPALLDPLEHLPAQDLGRLLVDQLINGIDADRGVTPNLPQLDHQAHWELRESAPVFFLNAGLFNEALATQLTSLPLGAASGGFTYDYDAATGTFTRSSQSFGPILAERALTQGRHKLSFGLTYQRSHYDSFEDLDLENGDLKLYLEHERRAALGAAPAYMYLFTWEGNFKGNLLKSAHAMEIPFVFGHPDIAPMTGDSPERQELAGLMSDAWVAFARTGNPNHAGLPEWPAYNAERRSTMLFNVPSTVEDDPRREERLAWDSMPIDRMRGFLMPRRATQPA